MLRTKALDYHLPPGLIATRPAEPRDSARLLVVSRSDHSLVEHRHFQDLPDYLEPNDLLLVNQTTVLPARFRGRRADTGAKLEGLFLDQTPDANWRVMIKANTRLRPDQRITLADTTGADSPFTLKLLQRTQDAWLATLHDTQSDAPKTTPPQEVLNRIGATPIPPYILAARRDRNDTIEEQADRAWYQTTYADPQAAASVAAPTAGLHFTPQLLQRLESLNINRAPVLLNVGHGTFKPIESDHAEDHPIHAEHIHIPPQTIAALNAIKATTGRGGRTGGEDNGAGEGGGGGRRVCVGTTTVRAVESLPYPLSPALLTEGHTADTDLFILPGFTFRHTDALITNFHLPKSTLLALVGAFLNGGVPRLLDLYQAAIDEKYRFYSYGDAMIILP